jgi:uncharacterized protein (DUF1015 family)
MPPLVRPFTGFVPNAQFASRVVGPARALLAPELRNAGVDDPLSFRHVVGRSAGPPLDVAVAWVKHAQEIGALNPVVDAVIVHSAQREGARAVGVLADVSLDAYGDGNIKLHEKTIAKTEGKMVDYMASTRIYGNPVALAHRGDATLAALLARHVERAVDTEFATIDGTLHRLWIVTGDDAAALCDRFDGDLYIADGHHRLAAASVLAANEGRSGDYVPAGLYAEHECVVKAFARGIRDAPIVGDELIEKLSAEFELTELDEAVPRPMAQHTFGVRIADRSFLLTVPDELIEGDVYDRLDVNLLQHLILEPLFGIDNPRSDQRLDVIADVGPDAEHPERYDAWFLPYPTSVGEVMDVADMGRTMPPKSTFFQPKVPGGILVRPIDSDG